MSTGKILAGDYPNNTFISNSFSFNNTLTLVQGVSKSIDITKKIKNVEIITEENQKKFVGAAGWGLVGGLALGPLGLIAGILAGGNKKKMLVACELKSGEKFIAEVDSKLYQSILSASY